MSRSAARAAALPTGILLGLAAAAGLTSCASPGHAASASAPQAAVGRAGDPLSGLAPLASYQQLGTQDQGIVAAATVAIQDACMLTRGITRQLIGQNIQLIQARVAAVAAAGARLHLPPPADFSQGPLGIDDPAIARRYGYTNPWAALGDAVSNDSLGPGQDFPYTVFAHAQTGCLPATQATDAAAFANLGGQGPALVESLETEASTMASSDSAVVRATSHWSACMSGQGFSYSSPEGIRGSPEAVYDTMTTYFQKPSAAQIATAIGDVACKQKTGLDSVFTAAESRYAAELAAQNAAELASFRTDLLAQVRHAERLLREPRYASVLGLAEQQEAAANALAATQ
jgi:hypothetical protein